MKTETKDYKIIEDKREKFTVLNFLEKKTNKIVVIMWKEFRTKKEIEDTLEILQG